MSALERDAVCLSRLLCAEEEPALLFTGHREVKPARSEEWPNHLTWGWRAPAPGKAHSQCVWLTSRGKQNRAIAGPPRHRPGLAADNTSGKQETQRDGVGREAGGGTGMGNTCKSMADPCQCMQKPLQYCKVISLQLIKINEKKKKKKETRV